jgi:hypothetical protein
VNYLKALPLFVTVALLVNPVPSFAQQFNSQEIGFGMPDIEITPQSGPPGTQIEITVKNMPPPPADHDPRIEFFVYLPFVTAIGGNVKNNCNGEHCFPVYSFEEINEDKLAPKTITFSLFSTDNPDPTVQSGQMESVCDVKVNEKTIERYSTVCNSNDQPLDLYEIKFAYGIQGSDLFDVRKSIWFTVTEKQEKQPDELQNPDDILFEQYEAGELTDEEFEKALSELGYDAEEIRQAKALLGRLPHQQGSYAPEQKEAIEEGIKKAEEASAQDAIIEEIEEQAPAEDKTVTLSEDVQLGQPEKLEEKGGCLIATAAYGSELSSQVQLLREIRENVLFGTNSGTTFMAGFNEFYYTFSPAVADWERQSPAFKELVKLTITPMLSTLSILNYVDVDSESEMLGYGIGIILLNVGMYFVIPAVIIIKVRQHFNKN